MLATLTQSNKIRSFFHPRMERGITFEGNIVSHQAGDIILREKNARIMAGAKPKSSSTWKPKINGA
jgi:hypothetical protein